MKPTEEHLKALVRSVQAQLGLNAWELRVHVGEVTDDLEPGRRLSGASIAYPEYMAGDIYLDPDQIEFDHADVERLVRHEVLHIALSPMASLMDLWASGDKERQHMATYVNELVTTMLERAPLWNRDGTN